MGLLPAQRPRGRATGEAARSGALFPADPRPAAPARRGMNSARSAKVVRHAKYVTFQMAEVAVPRELFATILDRIQRFGVRPPLVQRELEVDAVRIRAPESFSRTHQGWIGTMEQPGRHESRQERSFRLDRAVRLDTIATSNLIIGKCRCLDRRSARGWGTKESGLPEGGLG